MILMLATMERPVHKFEDLCSSSLCLCRGWPSADVLLRTIFYRCALLFEVTVEEALEDAATVSVPVIWPFLHYGQKIWSLI